MVRNSLALIMALTLAWSAQAAGDRAKPPTAVMAHTVALQTVTDRIEALGTLKANEAVAVTVHASDFVTDLLFEDGQRVKQGDLLLKLESGEEEALLQEARYTLEEARSQLERIKVIAKKGDASQSLLDERQREFNVAKSRLAAIESRLADRKVYAPFSGVVGLRNVSPGAYLSPGDVITTLIDNSTMKLDFGIPAVYLAEIETGINIEARTPTYPNRLFSGRIATINNQVDPVSRSVQVRARIPNPDGLLKPGMLMEVQLLTRQRRALVIPEEAIIPVATKSFVYVVEQENGKNLAKRREVTTGSRWEGKVEILSGLEPGLQLVTDGTNKLQPDSPVTLISTIDKAGSGAR